MLTPEEQQRKAAFLAELQALGQRYGIDFAAGVKRKLIYVDNLDGRGQQVHEDSWVEIEFVPVPGWQPPVAPPDQSSLPRMDVASGGTMLLAADDR